MISWHTFGPFRLPGPGNTPESTGIPSRHLLEMRCDELRRQPRVDYEIKGALSTQLQLQQHVVTAHGAFGQAQPALDK